jgi:methyl-accepting chemotaxis protein
MSSGVQVSPEVLRVTGTVLQQVGDQFDEQLTALEQELLSFGQPWGNDDIGQLIGIAYEEVVSFAFDCLREVVAEVRESGVDLDGMAQRYEAVEQDISDRFTALFDQIGSV